MRKVWNTFIGIWALLGFAAAIVGWRQFFRDLTQQFRKVPDPE